MFESQSRRVRVGYSDLLRYQVESLLPQIFFKTKKLEKFLLLTRLKFPPTVLKQPNISKWHYKINFFFLLKHK